MTGMVENKDQTQKLIVDRMVICCSVQQNSKIGFKARSSFPVDMSPSLEEFCFADC